MMRAVQYFALLLFITGVRPGFANGQPSRAFEGRNIPVEFEGVVLERLPSPMIWSGVLATFQGIRYKVVNVISGPVEPGDQVVYYGLVGPPLSEPKEPVLSRYIFKVGQRLHVRAEKTPSGDYVSWETPNSNRDSEEVPLLSSSVPFAQDDRPKPVVSKDLLTAEQIAIYRAVLRNYMKGEDTALNLANTTELLSSDDLQKDTRCIKDGQLEFDASKVHEVHRLDGAVALGPKMVLVDPDRQNATVKKNDPDHSIRHGIEDHHPVTDKELKDAVKQAIASGLFTLSEIVFNRQHSRAILQYSFVCGMLCGHGNTVVLKKVAGKWKISHVCGGWIS